MTYAMRETNPGLPTRALRAGLTLALFALLVVPWSGRAHAVEVTDENVATLIEQATTAQEYEALAAYFRSRANEAVSEAARHRAMLSATTKRGRSVMRAHCTKLIEASEQQAQEYRALAADAEEQARAAAQGQ